MYIDPGTGSVLLQIILAASLSLGVLIKIFWSRIKVIFTKNKPSSGTDEDELLNPDKGDNE